MALTTVEELRGLKVIDADTHVIEPRDLWTSRVSAKWGTLVPQIRFNPETGVDSWYVGAKELFPCGMPSAEGFDKEWPPLHRARYDDIPSHHIDPSERLKIMDKFGIHAQVLYPNLGIFAATEYLGTEVDPQFAVDCVRAYNDFLADYQSVAPDRYIAVMTLPFWDLEATRREMARAKEIGHRGIVMSSRPEHFGLPTIDDPHWDPLWAQAQDLELSINFHIGSGKTPSYGTPATGTHVHYALVSTMIGNGNAYAISAVITGGVCHRFPRLNIVSVESGVGWLPYILELLDWQWNSCGVPEEHPEYDLLPSEYFKRQIYGCFWFEAKAADLALEILGPDNILFESDFPHPTSMSPGPKSYALPPLEYFEKYHGHWSDEAKRKVLHGNSARLYHLD
jgi:predicted TIM-barrel fold metal-dependent hydrolase